MTAAEQPAAAAETMTASWVLTVFTTPVTAGPTNTLGQCCSMYTAAGAGMAAQRGRAGLLIDSWHFFFGASTFDNSPRYGSMTSPTSSSPTRWHPSRSGSSGRRCTAARCPVTAC